MKVGIIGYSGVGKTSIYTLMSGQDVPAHALAERHLASVEVMDRRLDTLRELWQPKKFTRARFDVEDYPAFPVGDLSGKGEMLAAMREPDAHVVVVGAFEQAVMALPKERSTPLGQWRTLQEDLFLLDLEAVEKRILKTQDRIKKGGGSRAADARVVEVLTRIQSSMEKGSFGKEPLQDKEEKSVVQEMGLFSLKPRVLVFNVDETFDFHGKEAAEWLAQAPKSAILCAPIEKEIARMEGADRAEFLSSYGLTEPASERLTRLAYESLNLMSFFTMGPDEVRAWPIERGSDAVTAAARIHSDLARGFIRAEVSPYEATRAARDPKDLKTLAPPDLKGRDYVVQDGDILNIRFSV